MSCRRLPLPLPLPFPIRQDLHLSSLPSFRSGRPQASATAQGCRETAVSGGAAAAGAGTRGRRGRPGPLRGGRRLTAGDEGQLGWLIPGGGSSPVTGGPRKGQAHLLGRRREDSLLWSCPRHRLEGGKSSPIGGVFFNASGRSTVKFVATAGAVKSLG